MGICSMDAIPQLAEEDFRLSVRCGICFSRNEDSSRLAQTKNTRV
jgi:hypothetical protein